MSQALYTAMSGISSATTALSVISNNVANINTTAFKSSSVNFSDVYSTTISYGSVSSGDHGGTNPVQVGVGAQVSAISKNFTTGSATSTGQSTDLMIQGSGFFTVTDGGETYFTRAGDFSWDNNGNLVTSSGYKVVGTDSILSTTTSTDTVHVPTSIIPVVRGNENLGSQLVSSLNNISKAITTGYFQVTEGTSTPVNIVLSDSTLSGTIANMVTSINAQLTTAGLTDLTCSIATTGKLVFTYTGTSNCTFSTSNTPITSGGETYTATNFLTDIELDSFTMTGSSVATATSSTNTFSAGHFDVTYTNASGVPTTTAIDASAITTVAQLVTLINANATLAAEGITATYNASGGTITLNFDGVGSAAFADQTGSTTLTALGLNGRTLTRTAVTDSSKILDYTAEITDVTSAADSTSVNSIAINKDGSIQSTYANGDTLSVQMNAADTGYEFVYTTKAGVEISGTSLSVSANVAVPANFVIQLATVTNTDGLLSVGSNLYEAGPNSGDITYTVGNAMGAGAIKSGYLEASNVDLSEELSSMILAQRAIQANSRVFTTVSDTMDTVVNMGR